MKLEKEKIIDRVETAKKYGMKYSDLARAVGLPYTSVHGFIKGTYNMPTIKQVKIFRYADEYIRGLEELMLGL